MEQNTAQDVLVEHGLELGMPVGVDGELGLYRIVGVGRDGSLTVFGDVGRQFRSFLPEWCYPATRSGKGGKTSGPGDFLRSGVACGGGGRQSTATAVPTRQTVLASSIAGSQPMPARTTMLSARAELSVPPSWVA